MTRAPRSPRAMVQSGPARTRVRSSTRRSARGAVGDTLALRGLFGYHGGSEEEPMSRSPDLQRKIDVLMSLAAEDREGLPPRLRHARSTGALNPINIRHLRPLPGMRMSLLRILMTNACSYNCHYCPMRRDRDMPRTLLKPEELVRVFLGALARGC